MKKPTEQTSKIRKGFQSIGQYFTDLYHEKRWKFWAILAGIILIFLAILIILVVHFGNQTEEQNIQQFVASIQPLAANLAIKL